MAVSHPLRVGRRRLTRAERSGERPTTHPGFPTREPLRPCRRRTAHGGVFDRPLDDIRPAAQQGPHRRRLPAPRSRARDAARGRRGCRAGRLRPARGPPDCPSTQAFARWSIRLGATSGMSPSRTRPASVSGGSAAKPALKRSREAAGIGCVEHHQKRQVSERPLDLRGAVAGDDDARPERGRQGGLATCRTRLARRCASIFGSLPKRVPCPAASTMAVTPLTLPRSLRRPAAGAARRSPSGARRRRAP